MGSAPWIQDFGYGGIETGRCLGVPWYVRVSLFVALLGSGLWCYEVSRFSRVAGGAREGGVHWFRILLGEGI